MRKKLLSVVAAASMLFGATLYVGTPAVDAHTSWSTGHWRFVQGIAGSTWQVKAYTTKGTSNSSAIDYGQAWTRVGNYMYDATCANTASNCGDLWTPGHYYNGFYGIPEVVTTHCAKFTDGHILPESSNGHGFAGQWCTNWPQYLNLHWHVFSI